MNLKNSLREYIISELLGETIEFDDDETLLSDELVDSLGMMRLVAHIEELRSIEIPPEHLTIENFRSIDTICRYLDAGG